MRTLLAVMGDHPYNVPKERGGGTTHDRFHEIAYHSDANFIIIPDLRHELGDTDYGNPEWRPKHRTLVAMRRMASRFARDGGYDYLFLVENDCLLPVDALERLLAHGKDIVVPRHEFPDFPPAKAMVWQPQYSKEVTGLQHLEWAGYPATLFRMSAFSNIDPMFIGGGEGVDYANWRQHGIEAHVDLDMEAVNLELASAHKVMLYVPGCYRMHRNKKGHRCNGMLSARDPVKDPNALAAECIDCGYYFEFLPPAGYRGETLQQLGLLEPTVAG